MEQMKQSQKLRELVSALAAKLGLLEEASLSCCGVTLAQCQALVEVGSAGSLSLGDISERMGLDNSTLSRTVNSLVNKGLCERTADPKDRRYVSISLTPQGNGMYRSIEQTMDRYYDSLLNAVPEGQRAQVLESMELLLKAASAIGCCGGE